MRQLSEKSGRLGDAVLGSMEKHMGKPDITQKPDYFRIGGNTLRTSQYVLRYRAIRRTMAANAKPDNNILRWRLHRIFVDWIGRQCPDLHPRRDVGPVVLGRTT